MDLAIDRLVPLEGGITNGLVGKRAQHADAAPGVGGDAELLKITAPAERPETAGADNLISLTCNQMGAKQIVPVIFSSTPLLYDEDLSPQLQSGHQIGHGGHE